VVDEKERLSWCVYALETEQHVMATCPMTDTEIQVYRKYPDTFF
jgi:hypothetical protein